MLIAGAILVAAILVLIGLAGYAMEALAVLGILAISAFLGIGTFVWAMIESDGDFTTSLMLAGIMAAIPLAYIAYEWIKGWVSDRQTR